MERVLGIGGLFVRAADPTALTAWYERHLGVLPPPEDYGQRSWQQEAGSTVFAAMPADAAHFAGQRSWAVNFRVAGLDAMVAQLRDAGIAVEVDPEQYPNGRFASLADPEGNVVELWEPGGVDAPGGAPPAGGESPR